LQEIEQEGEEEYPRRFGEYKASSASVEHLLCGLADVYRETVWVFYLLSSDPDGVSTTEQTDG